MAKFDQFEKELLKHISKDSLRDSLSQIREATEVIWAPEQRIVRDFTDHGLKHCQRLAEKAVKLLEVNTGQSLSDREMYLLLAGIYLHDIGMQCDVTRFPEIANRVQELGGDEIRVTARTVSEYNLDEQKAIRKSHHLLTAAWIEHAYNTDEPNLKLEQAIKTVPEKLVADLIDVCKYHSKLPIRECPEVSEVYPDLRRRLVAALLRFCDELDVDSPRVDIEIVKLFSMDPRNAVYWWLHWNTTVHIKHGIVTLRVLLHPDDARRYGDLVESAFITEFKKKNHSVLNVLQNCGISIALSAYSGVKSYPFSKELPDEIIGVLLAINRPAEYEYPIAISYAKADRDVARGLAELLKGMKIGVWYDEYERADLLAKDLSMELSNVYERKAHYCVVIVSEAYVRSQWCKDELTSIRRRMAAQESEYLIQVRLDDSELPGVPASIKYLDYRHMDMALESIAETIFDKVMMAFRDREWRKYVQKRAKEGKAKDIPFLTPEIPQDSEEHLILWERHSTKRDEQKAIRERECAWVAPWSGVRVSEVELAYIDRQENDPKRYDNVMPELAREALHGWREENPEKYAEKAAEPWGALVRFEGYMEIHGLCQIELSPINYLYYIAIQARLWSPELSELRNQAFAQALVLNLNKRTPLPLMLPSHFAIHMGIVSKDNKVLLRQRTAATELFPEAWEAGIGEFMHGPRSTLKAFPSFTNEGVPDLALFLKNAVKEEIGYEGASEEDFRLFGFAVEYRTLAPKLLVVYRSDASIERLMEGALSSADRSPNVGYVKLTPHDVARVCVDPKYPTWGPTSKLVMMLALTHATPITKWTPVIDKVARLIDDYSALYSLEDNG